jgi:hypothetical protein
MKSKLFTGITIVSMIAIFGYSCVAPNKTLVKSVIIQTDRETYIPLMSSTVGIGLTPVITPEGIPQNVYFHWRTDYGSFIAWSSPDFIVKQLGTEVVNNGGKIYWSYDPSEMGIPKPLVTISLQLIETQSGLVLARSNLKIGWQDQDTAKVIG